MTFTAEDLETLAGLVADNWRSGVDRDWSARAGTLDLSCTQTADHAVDCTLAPAFFLASRKLDSYPAGEPFTLGPDARPLDLVEAVETAARVLTGVVAAAGPEVRAVIWLRPQVEARPAEDFLPRGALELALHAHDVGLGLDLPFVPPDGLCARLRGHTRRWPMWDLSGWTPPTMDGEPWLDLLRSSGRSPTGE